MGETGLGLLVQPPKRATERSIFEEKFKQSGLSIGLGGSLVAAAQSVTRDGDRLLLTTEGGFKRQLELPATGVERTYRARAYGDITQAQLEELIHGIEIEGVKYGKIDANLERRTGRNGWVEMTLTEGKNREVRRVLEHLGLEVSRLIRTRYGPFVLGELAPGTVGEVRRVDLIEFRKTLK